VGTPPSGPDLVAPGDPNTGEGWSVRWSGTPQLAPGSYRLTAASSGTLVVRVNGVAVPDGGTFTVSGPDVAGATADLVVTLTNNPAFDSNPYFLNFDWGYRLAREQLGTAPVLRLRELGQGGRVPAGTTVGWTVSAEDEEDGVLPADDLRVTVTLLHYGTGNPHDHPAGSFEGAGGSFTVDDSHAPGKIAFRFVGVATDSSGRVAGSDPVYVCLVGTVVGPCS
jgi:hypothetical protein